MKKKSDLVYFIVETADVILDIPKEGFECNYESFFPSKKWTEDEEGYLVYYTYKVYDSEGRDDQLNYHILDIYSNRGSAIDTAKSLAMLGSGYKVNYYATYQDFLNRDTDAIKKSIKYNDGTEIKYFNIGSWGYTFEESYVRKIKIKNSKDIDVLVFR